MWWLLGLIGTQGYLWPGPVDRFASSATACKGTPMPIDPSLLAQTIATLNGLDPERDLANTLHQAVVAAKKLFAVDAVGVMLATTTERCARSAPPTYAPRRLRATRKASPPVPAGRHLRPASRQSCTTPPWSRAGGRSLRSLLSCGSGPV